MMWALSAWMILAYMPWPVPLAYVHATFDGRSWRIECDHIVRKVQ